MVREVVEAALFIGVRRRIADGRRERLLGDDVNFYLLPEMIPPADRNGKSRASGGA